jgi:predicted negative regulator of RcsB-dependent stress response
MKGFLTLLVLVALCLLGVGLYRGWFSVSTEKKDEKPTVSFSVDQEKIKEDEEKAKKKLQDLERQVKEKTSGKTDPVKEK